MFQVEAVASGGYVVAGVRDAGLWAFRIREDGEPVWTHLPHPLEPFSAIFSSVTLLPAGPDFVLAANVSVMTTDWRNSTNAIRLIRFRTE
jgi:hypothetical protein